MLLVKIPGPAPVLVVLSDVVGLGLVDQQTPLAVTAAPPSLVTFPPETAEVAVIELTAVVVTVGNMASVVNESSLP
jgi:hypothetical protein